METNNSVRLQNYLDDLNRKLDGIIEAIGSEVKNTDRLISVKEASRLLNRSEYCLRQDIKDGKLPAKKVGRGWLISYNEIQRRIKN